MISILCFIFIESSNQQFNFRFYQAYLFYGQLLFTAHVLGKIEKTCLGARDRREGTENGREGIEEWREGIENGREGIEKGREGIEEWREGTEKGHEGIEDGREVYQNDKKELK